MKKGSDEWAAPSTFQPMVSKAADEVLSAIRDIGSIFDLTMEYIQAELPYAYEDYENACAKALTKADDARVHQDFIDKWYDRVFDPAREIVVTMVLAEAIKAHAMGSKYVIPQEVS